MGSRGSGKSCRRAEKASYFGSLRRRCILHNYLKYLVFYAKPRAGPVLADWMSSSIPRGRPVVSVTPDIIASTPFQAPAPRGKADPTPSNDSFASLVDSNASAAANNNDRAQDAAPDRRPASSRRNDAATANDKPRDVKADQPERNDSDNRDVADDDQAGPDKPVEAGSDKRAETKSTKTSEKADESKPADKPSSDETEGTDTTGIQAAADSAGIKTIDAIGAAIVVPVAVAGVQAPATPSATTTANSDSSTISVAAVTATTALTQTATAPATTDAAAKTVTSDAKTAAPAADGETTTPTTPAKPTVDATPTTGIALTTASARPAAPKTTTAKISTSTGEAAASSEDAGTSKASSDAPASNINTAPAAAGTEQPVTTKPDVKNARTDAPKPEAGAQTPAATAAHLTTGGHDTAPGQSNAPVNDVQTVAFQPQIQTTATQSQPSYTVTAATQTASVPLSGLAMEIAASVQSGKSRFEIRLDPADLGRIDVRIDVDRQGQVTSHLTVEKPETLSMLRQDAPQLQRALNDAGLSTGDGGLQFSLRDQSSSGQQNGNQSNPNAQRLIVTEEEIVPAVMANNYGRMLGASGALDIRV
jgi:chemotaxis protein MotD